MLRRADYPDDRALRDRLIAEARAHSSAGNAERALVALRELEWATIDETVLAATDALFAGNLDLGLTGVSQAPRHRRATLALPWWRLVSACWSWVSSITSSSCLG